MSSITEPLKPIDFALNKKLNYFDYSFYKNEDFSLFRSATEENKENPQFSLIYSLLLAVSKYFNLSDNKSRHEKIQIMQKEVQERLKETDNVKHSYSIFKEKINKLVFEFFDFFKEKDDEHSQNQTYSSNLKQLLSALHIEDENKKFKCFQLLTEIISYSSFQKILKDAYNKWMTNDSSDTLKKKIYIGINNFFKYTDIFDEVEEKKVEFFKLNYFSFVDELVDIIESKFPLFQLEKNNIDGMILEILSSIFNVNIYFLNNVTRLPIIFDNYKIDKDRDNVLLISFDFHHFEPVTVVSQDKIMTRVLKYNDNNNVIKTIEEYIQNNLFLSIDEHVEEKNDEEEEEKDVTNKKEEEEEKEEVNEKHDEEKESNDEKQEDEISYDNNEIEKKEENSDDEMINNINNFEQ